MDVKYKKYIWLIVAVLLITVVCVLTCKKDKEVHETTPPVEVEAIDDSNLHLVILTPQAAKRVGIETTTIKSNQYVLPYSSLLYDENGDTWVYINTEDTTYIRERVFVNRIYEDTVLLSRSLPIGTVVVSVGATELYGAENGIGAGKGH